MLVDFKHNSPMPSPAKTPSEPQEEGPVLPARSERQQAILDAALGCFLEAGVEATTIEDIRKRSGASIGSIYHHFGSKDAIAALLYVSALEDHKQLLRARLARARTAEQTVKAIVRAYVDWVSGNPALSRFVLYNRSAVITGGASSVLKQHNRTELAPMLEQFYGFVASSELRMLPKECYLSILTGPAHDYARQWLGGRVQKPLAELREVFAETAWRALRPD